MVLKIRDSHVCLRHERDISDAIEQIYSFEIFSEMISNIIDKVIETAHKWQKKSLEKFYPFLFIDWLYVIIRREWRPKAVSFKFILGYDKKGFRTS